jgi:hypothetical protein
MTHATYTCKCCKQPFTARVADRKRGWARFCSKSCKAIKQTQRTGRGRPRHDYNDEEGFTYARYLDTVHPFSEEALQP